MKRLSRRRHGRSVFANVLLSLFVAFMLSVLVIFSSSLRVVVSSQVDAAALWAEDVIRPALALIAPSFEAQKPSSILDLHADLISSQEFATLEPRRWSHGANADAGPGNKRTAQESRAPLSWGSASLDFAKAPFTPSSGIWTVHLQEQPQPSSAFSEVLEFPAIPLAPGQSVELLPEMIAGVQDGERPGHWGASPLGVQVICIGATPDRLDAPGKLLLETKVQASESAPIIMNVSHAPLVGQVSLAAAAANQPERIKLTWSSESSGTLLILGLLKRPVEDVPESALGKPGSILVTANQIWSASEFFGKSRAQLEKRSSGSSMLIQKIWPEYSSSARNDGALLEHVRGSKGLGLIHAFTHRVDIQLDSALSLKDELLKDRSGSHSGAIAPHTDAVDSVSLPTRSIVTFHRFVGADGGEGLLPVIARLVRQGGLVHLNFLPTEERELNSKLVEAAQRRLMGEVLRGQISWAKLRSLSVFAKPHDLLQLNSTEEAARMDGAVAQLIMRVDEAARSAAQTNESKQHSHAVAYSPAVIHVSHFEDLVAGDERSDAPHIPKGFASGSALLSPLPESTLLPWQARLKAGVSQAEWAQWMGQAFSSTAAPADSSVTGTRASGSKNAAASVRQDSQLYLVAMTRGDDGALYVFDKGWVFLPRLELENIAVVQKHLPVFGIATDLISDAKHEIFRLESGLVRVRLDVVLLGSEMNRRIEFRSEFPLVRCSASRDTVTFAKVFGQDGTMTVTADVAAGEVPVPKAEKEAKQTTGLVLSCLVDKSVRNPVPKPRSERQERPDEARARAEAKARADAKADRLRLGLRPEVSDIATLSIRMTEDGKKFPLERIALGPYLESADISASESARTRSVVQFDLVKDFKRLLTLVAPEWQGTDFSAVILASASADLDVSHPTVIDWQPEIETFLEDRVKIAERVRASKL